jgi:hypothetical protein
MTRISKSTWDDIKGLRERLMDRRPTSVAEGAQFFVKDVASQFESVVLARLFLVVPLDSLPSIEKEIATRAAKDDARLKPATRVLSLVGTYGREEEWRDRTLSKGHRAIPLLDTAHVQLIPMIARLLADLEVDFQGLDDGRSIASQPMLGGLNAKFSIADARTSTDAKGRLVVPTREFVDTYGVKSTFGMGGSYADGTLAVAVFFTDEVVDPLVVDRFPSLISNFKMSTAAHLAAGRVYA